jgi:dihydrolipoamide dehydrogenase
MVEYSTKGGGEQKLECDRLIVSIGRVPNTQGLGAETVKLKLDQRGFVEVNAECRTNLPNVWAIGDVVRGPMLAHKAEDEGVAVAERIAGKHGHVDFNTIPWVIYTAPEIAWVGQGEEQAKAAGRSVKTGSFPFAASGRARAMEAGAGFCKIVADAGSDEILGVHVIGPMAGELIAEAVLAMEYSASSEDLQRTIHAHPTLSEAMHEAALAADKRAIDIPNR